MVPDAATEGRPLEFGPSWVAYLAYILLPSSFLIPFSLAGSLVAGVCSAFFTRWLYSVRIENGEVHGPRLRDDWEKFRPLKQSIPVADITFGPPPDFNPGFTLASASGERKIDASFLGKADRERLRKTLGLGEPPRLC